MPCWSVRAQSRLDARAVVRSFSAMTDARMTDARVVRIERLDLAFAPRVWPFARSRRAEIDANFARRKAERPALWNGEVLVLYEHTVEGAVFRGSYLKTDYASFISWIDWGFPEAGT